jgi:predicted nucleic acid-binding protein
VIFDTNVLIYLSKYILKPEKILTSYASISVITKIEALGFPFSDAEEHDLLLDICGELTVIQLTEPIVEKTIEIRQKNKVKLADALIYATAMVENLPLLTNNIKDFQYLSGKVELINPFDL